MEAVVKYKPINSATGKIGSSSLVKKQKKDKKISFTPTHASETSQKYYKFDVKLYSRTRRLILNPQCGIHLLFKQIWH